MNQLFGLQHRGGYQSNKAFGNIAPYKKRKKDDNKTIEEKFGLFGS